jgi:hypothetical protein
MTIHRFYRKGDPDKVGRLAGRGGVGSGLAVADPGAEGAVLFWLDGFRRWPRLPDFRRTIGANGSGHRQVALACQGAKVGTFVIEDQYLGRGKGAQSMIGLIRSGGMLVGHVQMWEPPVEVVWAPPWAWQKRLQKGPNVKERSMVHAERLLGREWLMSQGPSPIQQACADVIGIAAFYEEITRVQIERTQNDLGF